MMSNNNEQSFDDFLVELGLEDDETMHHESRRTTIPDEKESAPEIDLGALLQATPPVEPSASTPLLFVEEDPEPESQEFEQAEEVIPPPQKPIDDDELEELLEQFGSGYDDLVEDLAEETDTDEYLDDEGWSFDQVDDEVEKDAEAFAPIAMSHTDEDLDNEELDGKNSENSNIPEIDEEEDFMEGFDDDLDDETEEEPIDEAENTSLKKLKKNKEPSDRKKLFKSKWEDFKKQAAVELHGEDPSKKVPAKDEDKKLHQKEEPHEQEDDEDNDTTPRTNNKGIKLPPFKKLNKPVKWLASFYHKIINFIFGVLDGVLGFLGKIPLIGWPFRKLRELTKILKMVANAIPLMIVLGICIYVNLHTAPTETTLELPDQGAATFGQFTWEDGKASGTIKNTGETIVQTEPQFTIYTLQPTLNPISWFKPKPSTTCVGKLVQVPIDGEMIVNANCKKPDGLFPRTSGILHES